jgi:C-terminal processing protease CtpA/Prc
VIAAHFERNLVKPDTSDDLGIMKISFDQRIPTTFKPRYKGKTVMLIDERAISQSEHSGLFYRAANGTKFIGSPTAGANGDVTYFMAPGDIRINFSGHDVRWPDGKQLQRVGLTPDIEVRPTIEGIRAGRDEILERAVKYLETGQLP